jgi:predicted amidohydrolase
MRVLNLELMTFDVGLECEDAQAYADVVVNRVLAAWDEGAEVVVLPEFTWMGLERFVVREDALRGVADLFWVGLWPGIRQRLRRGDRAVVLGTAPCAAPDGSMRNRSPILSCGSELHQDKLHLTPWEEAFTGGDAMRIWEFRGIRMAVVICLDIEIPEISVALRGREVDVILVPSATESVLGVERVGRCADARAVELECHVGLCHLVGRAESDLIDENVGRLAAFSPSQTPFLSSVRKTESDLFEHGYHRMRVLLDIGAIRELRALSAETDPSKVRPGVISIQES